MIGSIAIYIKTKHPINSPNVKIVSHVCPSGQYLSLKLLIEFLAFTKKFSPSIFTFSVMIDISFLLSLNLLAPNSRLLSNDAQIKKFLNFFVNSYCAVVHFNQCLKRVHTSTNCNDIYQISVVQVGLLLYLHPYLSRVLTVVKLLWYLRSK